MVPIDFGVSRSKVKVYSDLEHKNSSPLNNLKTIKLGTL